MVMTTRRGAAITLRCSARMRTRGLNQTTVTIATILIVRVFSRWVMLPERTVAFSCPPWRATSRPATYSNPRDVTPKPWSVGRACADKA